MARERCRGGAANPTTPDENAAAVATPAASPLTSAQAATFILLELHGTRTNNAVFDGDGGVRILDLVGDATRECRGGRDETIGESSSLDRSLSLGVDPAKQRQRRETSARRPVAKRRRLRKIERGAASFSRHVGISRAAIESSRSTGGTVDEFLFDRNEPRFHRSHPPFDRWRPFPNLAPRGDDSAVAARFLLSTRPISGTSRPIPPP